MYYSSSSETQAQAQLDSFLKKRYSGYHWKLSRPMLSQLGATSHLSPHLTFGTISTRTVYQSTKALAEELKAQPKAEFSLKTFRDRLRWHDSFTQRLYFHPEIAYANRYPEFDQLYTPSALSGSYYPQPILDWSKTRKVNGKVVSDLRKLTKQRLLSQGGDEYDSAIAAKETVEKYWQHKDREYKEY
ncbi:hypothetical protein [Nostoc sp. GT001]|uniref:hypothetical protein n=1 Tax=Nostoc sp. GT001 TaxID=3056647 RepID=UPI0025AA84A4|nr:hypothetical protein [Nostoc sp. GT001]MDM9580163.1 hypothetical protein [Nostoc sp. GT001]